MATQRPGDTARARRRNFALAAAGGLGAVTVLAAIMGPGSGGHPSASHDARAGATPQPETAAAKLAAEAAGPTGGTSAQQVLDSNASFSGPRGVVTYHGYSIQVPKSWPVYDLAANPGQCVLYNRHAVYLGTPGSAQNCPATAVGHTEALLIQPVSKASAPQSAIVLPSGTAALPKKGALPSAAEAAADADHLIQVEVPRPGLLVTASYGSSQTNIRTILASATLTASSSSSGSAPGKPTAGTQSVSATGLQTVTSNAASVPKPGLTGLIGSGLGFDTCTVPSVSTMRSWLSSPYRVVATYLGGQNWACSYGNFSPSWVQQVAAQGWRFMPLWVGKQAPCTGAWGVATIDPGHAAAQGADEARSAVAKAQAFGYGRGSPIYFDMEGYDNTNGSCSAAVLTFLAGWTRYLHAAGYVSGVYSSASSGIRDLAGQFGNGSYSRPDDIWIADWNGTPVLSDQNVPNGDWANHQRLHQYNGPHQENWGGATVDMDTDAADGLVVGLPSAPVFRGPTETAQPSQLVVAPGKKASVHLTLRGVPGTKVFVRWQASAPKGLAVSPSYGRVDLWPRSVVYNVSMTLAPSASLRPGRYTIPITVTADNQEVGNAFVLVTVATRPWPTPHPIVLYAADSTSMGVAATTSQLFDLGRGALTGSFSQAWHDVEAGHALVLAVGRAAANALYFNACGWANPDNKRAGFTPFYYVGAPLRQSAGANFFELADGSNAAGTAKLTTLLTQYALAGTLPEFGTQSTAPIPPTVECLGSPNVRVP